MNGVCLRDAVEVVHIEWDAGLASDRDEVKDSVG